MAEALKRAFVFPGQGSQAVGMAKNLLDSPIVEMAQAAIVTFGQAREILGRDISNLPAEELNLTENTQPALVATSTAAWRGLSRLNIRPEIVAGHSLGEISALIAAGAISFEDGLKLSAERGKIMENVGKQIPGSMMAIIGLPIQAINSIAHETGVEIANFNSPSQFVVSGQVDAIEEAKKLVESQKARAVKLNVNIASHSSLMKPAEKQMAKALKKIKVYDPLIPVIQNTTGDFASTADEVKKELIEQLTHSVQFVKAVELMGREGISQFIEVGPKNVLTGLIKEINKKLGYQSEAISLETLLNGDAQQILVRGNRPGETIEIHFEVKFLFINGRYVLGAVLSSSFGDSKVFGLTNLSREHVMQFLEKEKNSIRKRLPAPKR